MKPPKTTSIILVLLLIVITGCGTARPSSGVSSDTAKIVPSATTIVREAVPQPKLAQSPVSAATDDTSASNASKDQNAFIPGAVDCPVTTNLAKYILQPNESPWPMLKCQSFPDSGEAFSGAMSLQPVLASEGRRYVPQNSEIPVTGLCPISSCIWSVALLFTSNADAEQSFRFLASKYEESVKGQTQQAYGVHLNSSTDSTQGKEVYKSWADDYSTFDQLRVSGNMLLLLHIDAANSILPKEDITRLADLIRSR